MRRITINQTSAKYILTLFNNNLNIKLDTAQLIIFIKNLFLFLYNAGQKNINFFIIANNALAGDCAAVNYFLSQNINSKNFFINTISKRTLNEVIKIVSPDIVFLLDYGIKDNILFNIARGPYFLIGTCDQYKHASLFDNYIPFEINTVELQYYFIELSLHATLAGMRKLNYYKELLNVNKILFI